MTVIKERYGATITRGNKHKRVRFTPNNGGVSISITGQRGGHLSTIWIDEDDFLETAVLLATRIKEQRRVRND